MNTEEEFRRFLTAVSESELGPLENLSSWTSGVRLAEGLDFVCMNTGRPVPGDILALLTAGSSGNAIWFVYVTIPQSVYLYASSDFHNSFFCQETLKTCPEKGSLLLCDDMVYCF